MAAGTAGAGKKERERKAEAIDYILAELADGKRHSEIEPKLAEYGVCDRTIRNWLAEAEGRQGADALKHRDRYRGKVLAGYLGIIRRAEEGVPTKVGRGEDATVKDVPNLLLAKVTYDSVAKMLGLNAPTQLDVMHTKGERPLRDKDDTTLHERLKLLETNGGARAN